MPQGTSSFHKIGLGNLNQSNPRLRDIHAPCVTKTPEKLRSNSPPVNASRFGLNLSNMTL